jgi:hypothetical protein
MATTEDHLRYLEGGVVVLDDYLLSSEMFWSVGVPAAEQGVELPRLTMGGLLLARAMVRGSRLTAGQRERFEKVDAQIEAVRNRWRVAWERKCQHSFSSRLKSWRDFLEEYRDQPEEHADQYANAVKFRVMLQLLLKEPVQIGEAEFGLLSTMDKILRNIIRPGPYIWDAEQADGFPAEEYWFLYGHLPNKIN